MAEVKATLIKEETGWLAYLSVEDVREWVKPEPHFGMEGLQNTGRFGRVFELRTVADYSIFVSRNQKYLVDVPGFGALGQHNTRGEEI